VAPVHLVARAAVADSYRATLQTERTVKAIQEAMVATCGRVFVLLVVAAEALVDQELSEIQAMEMVGQDCRTP
jgi:hypothetical protein